MNQEKQDKLISDLGRPLALLIISTNKFFGELQPAQLKLASILALMLFFVAFLASDFFVVANAYGVFAAIEVAALNGPRHWVSDCSSGPYFYDCFASHDEPAFRVSLKFLFGFLTLVAAGFWFWASQRQLHLKQK